MAIFNKFNVFTENVAEKVHNLGADALTYALTNVAPVATNAVLLDLTQISYTNLSTRVPNRASSAQSPAGTLVLDDLILLASGGSVGPFRYVVLYNDTPASPLDPLIGWWDYASSITLADGETFTVDADPTNGVLTIS
jgi:hypothetical protein